jgi:hypothetical protein
MAWASLILKNSMTKNEARVITFVNKGGQKSFCFHTLSLVVRNNNWKIFIQKKIEIMAQTAGQIKPFGFMTLPLTESIYHCLLAWKRFIQKYRGDGGIITFPFLVLVFLRIHFFLYTGNFSIAANKNLGTKNSSYLSKH